MRRGQFITLEGGEGVGKSTLAQGLLTFLQSKGHTALATREPGGTPNAEAIRDMILRRRESPWNVNTNLLLFYAARQEHLHTLIRPALDRGDWVICDRFSDSTRAYQGLTDGADEDLLETLDAAIVGDAAPDLTLLLDAPPEAILSRRDQGDTDVFEARSIDFHNAVRNAFLKLAEAYPERIKTLDATQAAGKVLAEAKEAVDALIARTENPHR